MERPRLDLVTLETIQLILDRVKGNDGYLDSDVPCSGLLGTS